MLAWAANFRLFGIPILIGVGFFAGSTALELRAAPKPPDLAVGEASLPDGGAAGSEATPDSAFETTAPSPPAATLVPGYRCPSCEGAVEPDDRFCISCGSPLRPQDEQMSSLGSTGAGRWAVGMLASIGTLGLISVVVAVEHLRVRLPSLETLARLTILVILFQVATIVAWLVWQYRAVRRLHTLGIEGLRFSPKAAVGWWLVPIANLVLVFQAMVELWKGSDPRARRVNWKSGPTPKLLVAWWAALLASRVISGTAGATAVVGSPRSGLLWAIPADLMTVVAAVLAIVVVRGIDTRLGAPRWEGGGVDSPVVPEARKPTSRRDEGLPAVRDSVPSRIPTTATSAPGALGRGPTAAVEVSLVSGALGAGIGLIVGALLWWTLNLVLLFPLFRNSPSAYFTSHLLIGGFVLGAITGGWAVMFSGGRTTPLLAVVACVAAVGVAGGDALQFWLFSRLPPMDFLLQEIVLTWQFGLAALLAAVAGVGIPLLVVRRGFGDYG